jgi:ribonuclease D
LHNIPLILVPVEADKGGETFWNRLRSTPELRGRLHKLPLAAGRIKDVGELWKHCVDTDTTSKFKETVENLVWLTLSTSTSLGISNVDNVEKLSSFGAVRLADVENSGPDEYLVRDIVMHSQPTYLYASEGACKSLITAALGIAIASPEVSSIFGYPVETHGPVVLFDSELTVDRFKKRVVDICNGLGVDLPNEIYYKNVVGMPPRASFPELHSLADHVGAVAVVIDSIGFATRGDPESYGDVRNQSTEFIDPLIKLGVAPIVVDHKPHVGDHMIGSVAKGYHGRFIFRVDDKDGDDRTPGERHVCLVNKKASFAEEGHKIGLTLKFQQGAIRFEHDKRVEEQPINVSEPTVEERIKESLKSGDKTKEGIHNHTGIPVNTLSTRLKPMVNAKAIREVGRDGKKIVYGLYDTGTTEDGDIGDSTTLSTLDIPREVEVDKVRKPPLSYSFISGAAGLLPVIEQVSTSTGPVALDTETSSLQVNEAKVRLMQLRVGNETTPVLVDCQSVDVHPLLNVLKDKHLLGHNLAYDLAVLSNCYGYEHRGPVTDTMLMFQVYYGGTNKRANLKDALKAILGIEISKDEQASDWMGELTPEMLEYAAIDVLHLHALKDALEAKIDDTAKHLWPVVDLEHRMTKVTLT